MRPVKHLTPRYIWNRSLVILDQKLYPTDPWLTRDAIKLLSQLLKPTDVGLEFGSGRSTSWFLNRVEKLYSVESSPEWYGIVSHKCAQDISSGKLDYRLCETEDKYAGRALELADNSIDFCLVDGVFRDRCALNSLSKVKTGGIFIVDNVNQELPNTWSKSPNTLRDKPSTELWAEFMERTQNWRSIWTSNGVWDTCIWIKTD